jgi:hypothetical protein
MAELATISWPRPAGGRDLANHGAADLVSVANRGDGQMSLLNRILGRESQGSKPRVRVCLECGMPLDQHKQWCAIWQTQREMEKKQTAVPEAGS